MLVTSDRRYRFPVPAEDLWRAIAEVDDYRRWWPWLTAFDGRSLDAGARWRCVVQPPLPYAVRFTVTLDDVVPPRRITASVAGDVVGSAVLEIVDDDLDGSDGCEARLVSHLSPGSTVLRAVAALARPVVRFGHDWVLDAGARQFQERVLAS